MVYEKVLNSDGNGFSSKSTAVSNDLIAIGNLTNPQVEMVAAQRSISSLGVISEEMEDTDQELDNAEIIVSKLLTITGDQLVIDFANSDQDASSYVFVHNVDNLKFVFQNVGSSFRIPLSFTRRHDASTNIYNIDFANSTVNGTAGIIKAPPYILGQDPDSVNAIFIAINSATDVAVTISGTRQPPTVLQTQEELQSLQDHHYNVIYANQNQPSVNVGTPLFSNEIAVAAASNVASGSGVTLTGTENQIISRTNGLPTRYQSRSVSGRKFEKTITVFENAGSLSLDLVSNKVAVFHATHATDNLILNITARSGVYSALVVLERTKDATATVRSIDWDNSTVNGVPGQITVSGNPLGQESSNKNSIQLYTQDGLSFVADIQYTR